MQDAGLIIVAAGYGTRMAGTGVRKALIELAGEPIVTRAVRALRESRALPTVVVAHPDDLGAVREALAADAAGITVVAGGERRQDSVAAGVRALAELNPDIEWVAVHDAARPFATAGLLDRVLAAAAGNGCAIPGVPVVDTIKLVNAERRVVETPERSRLVAVQTPQAFRLKRLIELLERAAAAGETVTDEAMLFERAGEAAVVVEGEAENRKITTAEDLRWAEAWMNRANPER